MKFQFLISTVIALLLVSCGSSSGLFEKLANNQNSDGITGGDGYSAAIRQNFTQAFQYAAYDILWVLDNSGSMVDEVNYVRDNVSYFAQTMQARRSIQYQMAVVNTDWRDNTWGHGKFRGTTPIISYTHTNPVAEFENAVNDIHMCANGACSTTNGNEMGLGSARQALTDNGSTFLRNNASLFVIVVSDENDVSCVPNSGGTACNGGGNGSLATVNSYVTYFNGVKPAGTGAVSFYPIAAVSLADCATNLSVGTRYFDVLTGLGSGQSGSVCQSEMGNSINRIANTIADNGLCFALAYPPKATTVNVYVDDVLVKTGYSIDNTKTAVCFDTNHIPQNGQRIGIEYFRK